MLLKTKGQDAHDTVTLKDKLRPGLGKSERTIGTAMGYEPFQLVLVALVGLLLLLLMLMLISSQSVSALLLLIRLRKAESTSPKSQQLPNCGCRRSWVQCQPCWQCWTALWPPSEPRPLCPLPCWHRRICLCCCLLSKPSCPRRLVPSCSRCVPTSDHTFLEI